MILLTLLILLMAGPAWAAAPAFDTAASNQGDTVASISVSVTPAVVADRLLAACIIDNDGSANITAVHFNTTETLTAVVNDVSSGVGEFQGQLYRRIAPSTGAHDLQVDFVSAGSTGVIGGLVFNGADQTTPLGTAASQGSAGVITSATMDVTSAADELAFDCHGTSSAEVVTFGGGQTSQTTNAYFNFSASTKAGGAPTVTMTRAWGGGNERSVLFGASVKPVAAAPAPGDGRRATIVE
jgi:hypothetical protein